MAGWGNIVTDYYVTASVVIYKTPCDTLYALLKSIPGHVFVTIIDNSPGKTFDLQDIPFERPGVAYRHAGENLGYGKGHNLALSLSPPSEFHLIVNPDIVIEEGAIESMCALMEQEADIGMTSPMFRYGDGALQCLNRRYPTFFDLLLRRLPSFLLTDPMRLRMQHHEMQDVGYGSVCDVECMSGAFMLCRRLLLEDVGGFDESYFMYFEDFDLCRSLQQNGSRTVYVPDAHVTHHWERASRQNLYMTLVHIRSMLHYFNKWGWRLY